MGKASPRKGNMKNQEKTPIIPQTYPITDVLFESDFLGYKEGKIAEMSVHGKKLNVLIFSIKQTKTSEVSSTSRWELTGVSIEPSARQLAEGFYQNILRKIDDRAVMIATVRSMAGGRDAVSINYSTLTQRGTLTIIDPYRSQ